MEHTGTILIVDDEPLGRQTLKALLIAEGHHLIFARDGQEALSLAVESIPDLVLLDVMMPRLDGFEVCRALRTHPMLAQVPIIFVTALDDDESRLRGLQAGADEFVSKPINKIELRTRVRNVLALNRYRQLLEERAELDRMHRALVEAYEATLCGWARALELRDAETEGHTQRVTEMTVRLAQAVGIVEPELTAIRWGALLHDIGKLSIPDAILLKPGPLTAQEQATMRQHPEYACKMLDPIAYLRPAMDIPRCHHEKWDGSGYPQGLAGEQIPLAARIFSVVDVWDALRSTRPYHRPWPETRVLDHLHEQAGRAFDPDMVQAFIALVKEENTK